MKPDPVTTRHGARTDGETARCICGAKAGMMHPHLLDVQADMAAVIDHLRDLALTATTTDPETIASGESGRAAWQLITETLRLTGGDA